MNIRKHRGMLTVTAIVVMLSMLFVSCSEPQNEIPGSASLTVRVADMTSAKTITPSGNVDVSHYKITVDNVAEDVHVTSDYLAKGESFTVTNVPAGLWSATVDAYVLNEGNYVKVATATSAETRVSASESATLTVTLDNLDDSLSGNITVTLKMPSELDDENDIFWYTYSIKGTGQRSGVGIEHTTREQGTTGADGLATVSITDDLMQGSYLLTVTVYDSAEEATTNVIRTGVDIMRLVAGLEATGQINLDSQLVNEEGFKVQITDKVGDILTPEIINGKDTYELDATDSETEFTVTLAEAVPDGFAMEWYVDGALADATSADNTSYTLALEKGKHSVVGIMRDDAMLMSVGSVFFDVNVKVKIDFKEPIFIFELNDDEQSYTVTGLMDGIGGFGNWIEGNLEIPATYKGLPVTKIGNNAFKDREVVYFNSIVIPEGVTEIGESAFEGGTYVDEIIIPDSVTSIGDKAFMMCSNLSSINIPEGITSIGNNTFAYCRDLTSINIPDSVKLIGSRAFGDCSSLISIIIPDNVTSIGYSAFHGCSSLETVKISDASQLKSIGYAAFTGCSELTNINIPEGVTTIAAGTFAKCSNLSEVTLPSTLETIEDDTSYQLGVFENCISLKSIAIPDGVISIGEKAFAGCSALETVEISDASKLESIGSRAFEKCSSLENIIIPNNVTLIENSAFFGCSALATVEFSDTSQLESIRSRAFEKCSSLSNILIPDSVTSIEYRAFGVCSLLTDIYCEAAEQPEGWSSVWLDDCAADVFWGASRSEYDAIMNNDSVSYEVPEPAISVNGDVIITCDKSFAHIYYTVDGSEPTKDNGTLYEEPFVVSDGVTVKAVAYVGNGIYSTVAESSGE